VPCRVAVAKIGGLAVQVVRDYALHMNQEQTMQSLAPSLTRRIAQGIVFLPFAAAYLLGVYSVEVSHWAGVEAVGWAAQHAIPIGLYLAVLVVLAYVTTPRFVSWDESSFQFQSRFGPVQTFSWTSLEAHGFQRGMFVLRFAEGPLFRLTHWDFDRDHWKQFVVFLRTRHAERSHGRLNWWG
jgi:hypothetical protein